MDKTKSGRFGAAGTYTPYFGVLCTAASDKQRERARVGLSILHKDILQNTRFANAYTIFYGKEGVQWEQQLLEASFLE